jgi:BirA family biotin operon repressor/biotin-[acetyl-CoA-carboxylase] ligase
VIDLWEGDAPAAWAARWRLPQLEVHDRIGSTNDRAKQLAESGADPFTTVIAEEQLAGRGREGRRWESPAGSGLWMSVVAPPTRALDRALVPLRAGLAVCRAVERAAPGVHAGLKWPNDVLVSGRKLSGVLCEAAGDAVVIGIGINVRPGALGSELADSAVALEDAANARVDRAALAGHLLAELRELLGPGPLALHGALERELMERDVLKGRAVTAAAGDVGVACGIDRDGALRVEVAPGDVRRVLAGGVRIRD